MTRAASVDVIVCDLGGVLIELVGVEVMLDWCPHVEDNEALWALWLRSPAVRAYETGRSTRATFATAVVEEFALPVAPEEFLDAFEHWPRSLYPGAAALLTRLKSRYRLASASNTNELHWRRFSDDWSLPAHFHHNFPSHQVGKLKPDADYFAHVVAEIGADPARVLFLDDNVINVKAARDAGLHSHQVRGVEGLSKRLAALGLLD